MPWVRTDNLTLAADRNVTFMPAGQEVSIAPLSSTADLWTFSVNDWPGVRAYIYALQPELDIRQRIGEMVRVPIDPLARSFFSWPIDTIVNQNGALVGYLANVAQGVTPLTALLASRKSLSYNKKICIAKNLCVALAAIHQSDLVFGSLTPDLIFVEPKSCRVFLNPGLNAQFIGGSGDLFTCAVGVREFLAPEIHWFLSQGGTLGGIIPRYTATTNDAVKLNKIRSVYSVDTDLFALGVIIFALLNNNRHPLFCLIDGKRSERLLDLNLQAQRRPRPMLLMMGQRPKLSLRRRTIPITNYQLAWFRTGRAGKVYDNCFADLATMSASRPSTNKWYRLLERKETGIRARISRLFSRLQTEAKLKSPGASTSATDYRARQAIGNQYPTDLVGSEPLSSPRVFWRTTCLFALGIGLAFVACFMSLAPFANQFGYVALFAGSIAGMLLANGIAGKRRRLSGYRALNYAASFMSSFLVSVVCGILAGGI